MNEDRRLNREIIFDVPPTTFHELPKIPSCFCQYPMIFSCAWDENLKAWKWRFDMVAMVEGVGVQCTIPAPLDAATGKPEPITLETFIAVLEVFKKKLIDIKAGKG